QGFRFARYLHFPHDPACIIHNADAGLLDRYVQSAKMVHAALLLLMLEAANADLVSPSACSAAPKIFSYPQAGPADYPICSIKIVLRRMEACFWKACLEMSNARPVGCARRRLAIPVLGGNRRSWVAGIGMLMAWAISSAIK